MVSFGLIFISGEAFSTPRGPIVNIEIAREASLDDISTMLVHTFIRFIG